MKHISNILLTVTLLLSGLTVAAQPKNIPDSERQKWFKEIREYKHSFLAKELDLSREQQRKFFLLYDEMEDQTNRLNHETRQLEEKVANSETDATDIEYEKATEVLFDQKCKEGEIEKAYLIKFQSILSKKQLFQLKGAERKFTRDIMKHHRRLRSAQHK